MKDEALVVVLDTNIYLSGIFWRGLPHTLLEIARTGGYVVFATEEILQEVERKMVEKLKVSPVDADFLVTALKTYVNLVELREQVKLVKSDPDDDKFISCALSINARYIVSGDHHLLDLQEYQGIQVVTAREFINTLKARGN